MYCRNCKIRVEESGAAFCPSCGLEFSPGDTEPEAAVNDVRGTVVDGIMGLENLRFDEQLRLKPVRTDICFGDDGSSCLVKYFDEELLQRYKQMLEYQLGYLPALLKEEPQYSILEWKPTWLKLSEWSKGDISEAQRLAAWKEIAGFTSLCHGNGILINNYDPDTIWIDSETGLIIFEAVEYFTKAGDSPVVICVEAFSSPEVKMGSWENVSIRSDIYSLGKLFIYLYLNCSRNELAVREETYMDLAGLPLNIGFAIGKSLKEQQEERWESVDLLLECMEGRQDGFELKVQGFSERGFRDYNEDSIYYSTRRIQSMDKSCSTAVLVMCDGMGGLEGGEVASSMAVNFVGAELEKGIEGFLAKSDDRSGEDNIDITDIIRETIFLCNTRLIEEASRLGRKFGTTIVAAVIVNNRLYSGYVGDSRLYIFDESGSIKYVTEDHSLVGKRQAIGDISEEEALTHSSKNIIYQALGLKDVIRIDTREEDLMRGYRVMLCSDGICGVFLKKDISKIFAEYRDMGELSARLFYEAMERGSEDNCSLIIVEVLG